jgi:hypothetical protein
VKVKVRILILVAALAALPALAEDVSFKGRTLDVATGQEARPILRMTGTQYVLPRSQEQLVNQAQACLGGQGGIAIESADAAQGLLVARVATSFRASFATQTLRSRLELTAGEGYFQVVESELALAQASEDGNATYAPLVQDGGLWEKGLEALIQTENKLVDCLYK